MTSLDFVEFQLTPKMRGTTFHRPEFGKLDQTRLAVFCIVLSTH